ncbi:hypothetical protein [Streptomyces shenzhenensis]|uniref:hypothetical protein n=1 Tax=Streptomyces TaxID=1883 RepID=UPI001F2170DF|nr:hypothetical protein [Streptomyces shenzhenensis]
MRFRSTITAIAIAIAAAMLTACTSTTEHSTTSSRPKATAGDLTQKQKDDALAAAGIPPEPTAAKRAELLRALAAANPDIVKYEDKAIDAARNQCSAINGGGARLDYLAAQRFTYKDVTTSEAQGKQINAALKGIGFCKV